MERIVKLVAPEMRNKTYNCSVIHFNCKNAFQIISLLLWRINQSYPADNQTSVQMAAFHSRIYFQNKEFGRIYVAKNVKSSFSQKEASS